MALAKLCDLEDQDVGKFIDSFDTVLTDCDGVLWQANRAIEGAPETIGALRKLGKRIIFVTNNSTKSRKQYVKKCRDLDFGGSHEDIFTTSYLCARYLKQRNFQKKVYLFGGKGISAELDEACFRHVGSEPDAFSQSPEVLAVLDTVTPFVAAEKDNIGCVIASFNASISYAKMTTAISFLEDPNVIFLGTNRDAKFPCGQGVSLPGTGAFIASIETGAGRTATILGKPEKFMFEAIQELHHIDRAKTIMIGDRCDTDILFGRNNGLRTVLVGTGINSYAEVKQWKESGDENLVKLVADYYLDSLGSMLPCLKKKLG